MEEDSKEAIDTAAQQADQGNVTAGKRAADGPPEDEPAAKHPAMDIDGAVKEEQDDIKQEFETEAKDDKPSDEEEKASAGTDDKAEGDIKTDEGDVKPEAAATKEDGQLSAGEKEDQPAVFPLTLGPRTFPTLDACLSYFRSLLKTWPENVPLNEYEHLVLSDLLKTCHPRPRSKIGPGVVAFKTKTSFEHASTCFFACHEGGTEVDFSYLKCVSHKVGHDVSARSHRTSRGGRGRGDGGGRGGRGRGRGMRGRGGRRGRGRGRGRGRD